MIQISKTKDVIIALIIGEISAWLLLILAKGLLSADLYATAGTWLRTLPIIFPILCAIFAFLVNIVGKNTPIVYQAGKFILVGGFNTLVDWGVLALAIFIFRNSFKIESGDVLFYVGSFTIVFYSLYKAISFIIAAINSFFWNKFWTFKREDSEKIGREFLQFFIVTLLGFLINVGIASGIFAQVNPIAGLNSDQWGIAAAVIATAISMVWNFLGYKFIVFDGKKNASQIMPEKKPAPEFPTRKIV